MEDELVKTTIRNQVLTSLKELNKKTAEKELAETTILNKLFKSEEWQSSQVIGVTLSMDLEFSTEKIIEQALKEGKKVGVPKTFPKGQMDFYYYDFQEILEPTKFGVLEPINDKKIDKDSIDLLIVPGVAFNQEGYRVGFGGGFYDRYLADFKGKTCSLVFNEQYVTNFKPDDYDMPVSKLFMVSDEGGL